ncbi:choice-of-anchor O protein [Desulfuromonas sp. AOP6]|uniref:choice-of-anchor O protein n=1 Tax=Desulfuromonas sp. AOP6 TaxID=1566351 RepID=UPI00127DA80F|nr:choice-of-anchor O protein [Desulfuromonas sp. AOP6]BCA81135.1 hypothetical protein AOP6_2922 [Desulfuromonas sp. AOP6]
MKTWIRLVMGTVVLMATVISPAYGSAVYHEGPGLLQAPLITQTLQQVGTAKVWNTGDAFHVKLDAVDESWQLLDVHIYVGVEPVPATKKGNLIPGKFNYKAEALHAPSYDLELSLADDLGFSWGEPYMDLRIQNIAVHVSMAGVGADGKPVSAAAWAYTGDGCATEVGIYDDAYYAEFEGVGKGWWFSYMLSHPRRGHFIDSPVEGLSFATPTHGGITDEAGAFDFFPDEKVSLSIGHYALGSTVADHRISPLDLFEMADTDSAEVINMARLLQSLDADANPSDRITITPDVVAALDAAMGRLGLSAFDFSNGVEIEAILDEALYEASLRGLSLVMVSADEAKAHLEETVAGTMLRKNISRTPSEASAKAKMNDMRMWFPAFKADGSATIISYYDEVGNLIRTAEEAKPLVITYTDEDPTTGAADVWVAVSRDDGNTWKRMNLSRSADRSSFTLANGTPYYGDTRKPVMQVQGNNILVAWSSKFCNGGKPRYAIDVDPLTDDYPYDNAYYEDDIWGVGGPQLSHDYTEDGFPEVGELPYSCVWAARGIIATQKNVEAGLGDYVGDIVWFKPERLTSGRRDALQLFLGGADSAGMGLIWQEDPAGLRPGKFVGPGHGWSGATTNHKTDIWYSYISLADFAKVDANFAAGGDPQHDLVGRAKALVPMSLPVRISDNDVLNSDNLMATTTDFETWTPVANYESVGDGDGTHRYGFMIDGLCEDYYPFVNEQGETKNVCITADDRLMDGDTGASRPNLMMQPYTKTITGDNPATPDVVETSYTVPSAWAIVNYEETKGAGSGAPDTGETGSEPEDGTGFGGDTYIVEEGKNVIYHSFDFQNPETVSAGNIVNLPARDADGNILYLKDENGNLVLDYLGRPQLAYENARRARFILQGKSAAGPSATVMVIVYKEGEEGSGRPSDILLRRVVAPKTQTGNPYRFTNIVCDEWMTAPDGKQICAVGTQNISTVTPTFTTSSLGDPTTDDPYGAIKVVRWEQTAENLDDSTASNPYEDARAHRGVMRGDFLMVGYSYTPNWAAARNGNDKYDFFIRRSFDGGQTWSTDPLGSGVSYTQTFKVMTSDAEGNLDFERDADGNIVTEDVIYTYAAGEFEQARNMSQLPNAKSSVIEPRIVAPPAGKILDATVLDLNGNPTLSDTTAHPEDLYNNKVVYLAYGTSTNPKKDPLTGEQENAVPLDLFYTFTQDRGETFVLDEWEVNPDSDGNFAGETVTRWGYLAKGDPEQGEVQIRMTPDGSRFYGTWLQELAPLDEANPTHFEGSDIWFRRIMPMEFENNVGTPTTP